MRPGSGRFPIARTIAYAIVIGAIVAAFVLQMSRGVCPVP